MWIMYGCNVSRNWPWVLNQAKTLWKLKSSNFIPPSRNRWWFLNENYNMCFACDLNLNLSCSFRLSVHWQAHRGQWPCCEPEGPKGPRESLTHLILMLGLNPEVFNFYLKRNLGMCLPAYTLCFLVICNNPDFRTEIPKPSGWNPTIAHNTP